MGRLSQGLAPKTDLPVADGWSLQIPTHSGQVFRIEPAGIPI
jgi:hypothetical protein